MRYDAILNVNGTDFPVEIEPHRSLLSVVRTELGMPGSKEGCDDSECGACMMLLDGDPALAGLRGEHRLGAEADQRPAGLHRRRRVHDVAAERADVAGGMAADDR